MKSFLGNFYRDLAIFSGHTDSKSSDHIYKVTIIDGFNCSVCPDLGEVYLEYAPGSND